MTANHCKYLFKTLLVSDRLQQIFFIILVKVHDKMTHNLFFVLTMILRYFLQSCNARRDLHDLTLCWARPLFFAQQHEWLNERPQRIVSIKVSQIDQKIDNFETIIVIRDDGENMAGRAKIKNKVSNMERVVESLPLTKRPFKTGCNKIRI